ncbi:hypothetical protein [Ramlibacter humi]|uniref:Uncharacterized protein n=1 Tax=Ramlibacter humi TaxID=2530451 RepID=A0A4Z0CE10_9BURK|nr:hypothetical protein [Ramlibacter humi]TFZ08595.1 hypothetical protein EZ216_05420 [Ramlibacter humi]
MSALFVFLLRVFAFVAGLVMAASLAVAAALGLVAWLLHAGWARLTGRPARVDLRFFRGGFVPRRHPAPVYVPSGLPRRGHRPDVSDVDPK